MKKRKLTQVLSALLTLSLLFFTVACAKNQPVLTPTPSSEEKSASAIDSGADLPSSHTTAQRVGVSGIAFSTDEIFLAPGESARLEVSVLPENATNGRYTVRSADETVAVFSQGVVYAVGEGQTILTAVAEEDGYLARCCVCVIAQSETLSSGSSSPYTPDTPVISTETPTVDVEKRLSFLAAGDNIIHEAVFTDAEALAAAQAAENGYADRYYFDSMYDGVKDVIASADIAFVNAECPIAGEEYGISGYPRFNAPIEAAKALENIGFDVVNLANNHMLDMDSDCTGYKNTVENFKKHTSMLVIGGYTKADYNNLRVIERNGIRVAFLSYTTCLNYETVNSASPEMLIPYPAESDVRRQTALARENADFVVVSVHWGVENSSQVSDTQRSLARLFSSCGVDVILGHHSHTVEEVSWLEENGHKTLCFYSLGNFISTQHPIKNLVGIFGCFDFVIDEKGEKRIENAAALPHMTWYSTARADISVYLLENVTDDLIARHGSQLRTEENGGVFTLEDVKKNLETVLSDF